MKRLLCFLVALAMALVLLPTNVFGASNDVSVSQWGVTLNESVSVNFLLDIPQTDIDTTSVSIAVGDEDPISYAVADAAVQDGLYSFVADIAAAEMTENISLSYTLNGTETILGNYSVRQYALTLITGNYDTQTKNMALAMLHYGTACQVYFENEVESLANAGYEDTYVEYDIPTDVADVSVQGSVQGIHFYGASLIFRSQIAARFYFRITDTEKDYVLTANGTPHDLLLDDGGEIHYIEVPCFSPYALDEAVSVSAADGTDTLSIVYGPLTYISRMSTKGSPQMQSLVKAVYAYYAAAKEYKAYIDTETPDPDVPVVPDDPEDTTDPYAIQVGPFTESENGWTEAGIYMSAEYDDAPYDGWEFQYAPASASCIQLVRDGVTVDVAIPGVDALCKNDENLYYLHTTADTISSGLPLQDGDYLILSGKFSNAELEVDLNVATTYIYNDGGTLVFSTERPQ